MAIAGCGGSSAPAPLAAQDSATLRHDISAIRTAAAANDPSAAHAAAARLRADVESLRGTSRLSQSDARSILVAVGQVDSRISAEVHAPVPTASPAPAASPAAPAHPHPAAKEHGHRHKGAKDGGD
jgi:hypothetical protein